MSDSPFTIDRFEHDRIHLYHLPEEVFSQLIEPKPIYIIGSRGTGKTTLLNSLNWRERLNNRNLNEAIKGERFQNGLIGLYLKISNSHIILLNKWLEEETETLKGIITALYIDLLWLEELFLALSEIIIEGYIDISIEIEKTVISKIYERYLTFSQDLKLKEPNSFISTAILIEKLRTELVNIALNDTNPKQTTNVFPMDTPGSFGRKIAKMVCEMCDKAFPQLKSNWHIKVAFDEAEALSKIQRVIINTMIRSSESEVFFIISYATEIDELNETLIPNLSLGRADRVIIELNDMPDKGFRDFAEGVSLVRINAKLNKGINEFNLTDLLGSLQINKLLENELKKCENKKIQNHWLNKAKQLKKTSFYGDVFTKRGKELPIYQAYLIEKRNIQLPLPDEPKWKFRKQASAELRKRMVAAFLCLCTELNHKVPYAYDKMVLQMSDKCIRDYLLQMHYIFKETNKSLEKFIAIKNLDLSIQIKALRNASNQKITYISRSKIKSPKEVEKIVDGLAKITSSLQKNAGDISLSSSEKGRFVLNILERSSIDKDKEKILDIINQACEGGYLRMIKGHGKEWKFQIHASLAPFYEFSYRGAQYELRITMLDLWELINTSDDKDHERVIKNLLYKYNPKDPNAESQQLQLF